MKSLNISFPVNLYIKKAFINGRRLFGTPLTSNPRGYRTVQVERPRRKMTNWGWIEQLQDYFFDPDLLTDGAPPNDRGCRACGKVGILTCFNIFKIIIVLAWKSPRYHQIGHLVADCPRKKAADNRKRQEKDRRERQNQEDRRERQNQENQRQNHNEQSSGKKRDRQSQDRVKSCPAKKLWSAKLVTQEICIINVFFWQGDERSAENC